MLLAVGLCFVLRPLWVRQSLPPRAVADGAGLAVLIVIPLIAEGYLFSTLALPSLGGLRLQLMFANGTGKHGVTSMVDGTPFWRSGGMMYITFAGGRG
jgi:hypothetical protein